MNKKAQFSAVPRQIDKLITTFRKSNVPDSLVEISKVMVMDIQPKLREATHFELHPRNLTDFGGHYTFEDIERACNPELKLPYPCISIYRVVDEVPTFILAWDKTMWVKDDEALGNIIHIHSWRLLVEQGVWYPAHAIMQIDPKNVLDLSHLRRGSFGVWHSYGWVHSRAKLNSKGQMESSWSQHLIRDVIELCALLRKPNCKLETQRESRLRAKVGVKDKRQRVFYDVHRVVIDGTAQVERPEPKGGTHASPRWHKRRGYWRTMKKSGKVVWVNSCEVGKKSNGMVYKDYEVAVDA